MISPATRIQTLIGMVRDAGIECDAPLMRAAANEASQIIFLAGKLCMDARLALNLEVPFPAEADAENP